MLSVFLFKNHKDFLIKCRNNKYPSNILANPVRQNYIFKNFVFKKEYISHYLEFIRYLLPYYQQI